MCGGLDDFYAYETVEVGIPSTKFSGSVATADLSGGDDTIVGQPITEEDLDTYDVFLISAYADGIVFTISKGAKLIAGPVAERASLMKRIHSKVKIEFTVTLVSGTATDVYLQFAKVRRKSGQNSDDDGGC